MTEAYVRAVLLCAVTEAYLRGTADQAAGTVPASYAAIAEQVAEPVMVAVADLAQEALEQGFDGRAVPAR